jgi:hypothetical protein
MIVDVSNNPDCLVKTLDDGNTGMTGEHDPGLILTDGFRVIRKLDFKGILGTKLLLLFKAHDVLGGCINVDDTIPE